MATYFFATSGNDSNAGTSASPFKTIAKHNALTLHSGDVVSFNKGDAFYGSLIAASGVTYTSYGSGAQPILSGFDTLSGWTAFGSGVYYAIDTNLAATLQNLTMNGSPATLGRFPKTGYRTYTAHNANLSITDGTLPNSPSYIGAQVTIKKSHYNIDAGTVTGQASGVISYTGVSTVLPTNNYGYFFQNSPAFLTVLGEWSYDAATHRVYMYFGTNNPNSFVVKASRYDIVMDYSGKTGCTTSNLTIEGGNSFGIKAGANSNNNTFSNITILNSGYDGFCITSSNNITTNNLTISNCNNNGIILLPTTGSTVTNCIIDNCGTIPGRMRNGFGFTGYDSGNGMSIGTNDPTLNANTTVSNNRVTNSGYCGIYINGGGYTCSNNYVDTALMVKDDGALIYTWTGPTPHVYTARTISNNVVLNALGCIAGTDGAFGNEGNGIYTDENSSNLTVSGNTIAHCGNFGLYLHNSHEVTVNNNTIFDAANCHIAIISDDQLPRNFIITNNILVSRITTQALMQMKSKSGGASIADLTGWGIANGNQYGALHNTANLFTTQYGGTTATTNFAGWQTATAQDSASAFSNLSSYAASNQFLPNGSNSVLPVSLSGVYKDILNASYSGTINISAYNSRILFQTATALVPNISYSPSTKVFTQNQAIANMSPINTGGTPASYGISPGLPAGLNFNTTTGIISGTPTALSTATVYTVSAINGSGTGTTTINLTVNAKSPIISYAQPSYAFTQHTAIANVTPSNTGGVAVSYAISPSLPAGLSFNTSTGVISGNPTGTSLSVSYAITATNTGGSSTTHLSIFIFPQVPNIAYSPSTEVYLLATAITPISPTNTGGAIVSYSISPALPAGLSFNTTTGQISGTPTALSPVTTYAVTAVNSNGSSTAHITITVNSTAPNISYSPNTEILIQGVAMTAMSPINIGGAPASYSISASLPLGLNFDTNTGVVSGVPAALSTVTTYTITATNVTGVSHANVTLTIIAKVPALFYSPATNSYTINKPITLLTPTNTGGLPVTYAVSPSMPTGMSFNTATGAISGTPTVLQGPTTYTITATNTGGTGTATISIVVINITSGATIKKKRIRFS